MAWFPEERAIPGEEDLSGLSGPRFVTRDRPLSGEKLRFGNLAGGRNWLWRKG